MTYLVSINFGGYEYQKETGVFEDSDGNEKEGFRFTVEIADWYFKYEVPGSKTALLELLNLDIDGGVKRDNDLMYYFDNDFRKASVNRTLEKDDNRSSLPRRALTLHRQ